MKRLPSMLLIFGNISQLFSCTFRFTNDSANTVYIIQDEQGNETRHKIKVGETKTIPGLAAADNFFLYREARPREFIQEFEVAEDHCGQPEQAPTLITYRQLQNALAHNQPRLIFPHTTQEFYVHRGTMERKTFAEQPATN